MQSFVTKDIFEILTETRLLLQNFGVAKRDMPANKKHKQQRVVHGGVPQPPSAARRSSLAS